MIRQKKQEYLIISVLPLLLIIYSMMKISFLDFLVGMKIITLSDGVLLTDNFKIAGTYTSLINASIITLINIVLLYKLDMKINGLVISGIFLMLGFSLIGKNLINIIPFYVGAYLYALYNRQILGIDGRRWKCRWIYVNCSIMRRSNNKLWRGDIGARIEKVSGVLMDVSFLCGKILKDKIK